MNIRNLEQLNFALNNFKMGSLKVHVNEAFNNLIGRNRELKAEVETLRDSEKETQLKLLEKSIEIDELKGLIKKFSSQNDKGLEMIDKLFEVVETLEKVNTTLTQDNIKLVKMVQRLKGK